MCMPVKNCYVITKSRNRSTCSRVTKWKSIITGRNEPHGSCRRKVLNCQVFVIGFLQSVERKRAHAGSNVYKWVWSFSSGKGKVKVKFRGWGLLQHYSLSLIVLLTPKGVPSFISRGAAHQRHAVASASEGRNYRWNLANNPVIHLNC
jgi:hypothetical protein